MATPEEQINKLRTDLTAEDQRLSEEIKSKVDKTYLTDKEEKDKASLKKLIGDEIEKAGESTWKPDSRWYKTPEFMGFVSGLTGSLIGITFIKYDFAILDVTERVNRLGLRLVNYVTRRTSWDRQFLTSQQKDERKLNRRFSDLDHRVARLKKNINKRVGSLEGRVARIERSRRDVRGRVGGVPASPGSIPQAANTTAELNNLHQRIDALVAAIG